MATKREIFDLARSGAISVFGYVARAAEEVASGKVRWQTLNYQNRSQYNFSVFDGVAGISFFLADYSRLLGVEKAQNLALSGLRWCSLPEHQGYSRGLYTGRTGVGMAWLHLSQTIGDTTLIEHAIPPSETILKEDPGPVTDILGGAAGNGLFLLRLWAATREGRYLEGAVRNAEWLDTVATRDTLGCHWHFGLSPQHFWGFAHGLAGIAYFLLALFEATREERWARTVQECLQTLSDQARPDHDGLNWPPLVGMKETDRCQWCHGAAGVGLLFVRAFEVLKDTSCLETAKAAGETTFAYGDVRNNPSQCHGLAGNAELFIELYRTTHDALWLERAFAFAQMAFTYRELAPEGERWQADEPGYSSPDFMCGASGTGHFFLRLMEPDRTQMPLLQVH